MTIPAIKKYVVPRPSESARPMVANTAGPGDRPKRAVAMAKANSEFMF